LDIAYIDTNSTYFFEGYNDVSLKDTILKENEQFIDMLCNDPQNLIQIIDNNSFFSAEHRKNPLRDDTLKKYIDIFQNFKNGYKIVDRVIFYTGIESLEGIGNPIVLNDDIVIKAKDKELYVNLVFSSEDDEEKLFYLIFDKRTHNQQIRDYWGLDR
jgi:hypothetical protein